jgi:hypothetical protein
MIGPRGEHLVFLVSQPRAGSTLFQRVLAAHPHIATASEPWVMLHPLYALREGGVAAPYNADLAATALQAFLQETPGGIDDYDEGLRRMWSYLYSRITERAGPQRTHFVDKTPRYYFIIPELLRVFPAATVIVLMRNPLAVLCSLVSSWAEGGRLHHLQRWREDLWDAPRLLAEGGRLAGERGLVLRYEDFLADPETHARAACSKIGVEYDPAMIDYGRTDLPVWEFGDKKSVYKGGRPNAANAERWTADLADAQVWRLCDEYLRGLGRGTIEAMGYSFDALRKTLDAHRPRRGFFWTQSLQWLATPAVRRRGAKHAFIRFSYLARHRGVCHALMAAGRKGMRGAADAEHAGNDTP